MRLRRKEAIARHNHLNLLDNQRFAENGLA